MDNVFPETLAIACEWEDRSLLIPASRSGGDRSSRSTELLLGPGLTSPTASLCAFIISLCRRSTRLWISDTGVGEPHLELSSALELNAG